MGQIGTPLVGLYDHRLVALSSFIAVSASYGALDLGGRVTAARGWTRLAWLAGGAAAMGFGIWSMHFTGMLAFALPVPVSYHWPTVLLSLLAAILASAVALYVASRKEMDRVQALTGGLLMGLGIVGMHYIGMAAMRLSAVCQYSVPLVVLSVLVAVIASLAALVFTFDYREDFWGTTWAKLLSATVMGAAISLMHYTGMMSAKFISSAVVPDTSHVLSISSLAASGIAICTLVVLGAAVLTSAVDRRFAAQARELQNSERFRQIADSLRDTISLSNADLSQVLYVNRAYEAIWGRTAESLYADSKSWLEGVHPEDRQRVQKGIQRLIGGRPLDALECRVIRPDGALSWVRLQGFPLVDESRSIHRIVGTAHEFTKRKLAEEQLKRGQAHLAMAQRMARLGAWSWDPSSDEIYGSQEVYRIFEFDASEMKLTRESFLQRIHPDDRSRYDSAIKAAVVERSNWEIDYRIVLSDGSIKYIQGIGQPVFATCGKIIEFVGTEVDISDRKRSEMELRQVAAQLERERARLVEAQEVAKIGSWEAELQNLDVIWSEQTHRIFETDPSRFHPTRSKFREFIHPEDRAKVDAAFANSLDNRSPYKVEYRIIMPDGRVKVIEEQWRAFHDEQGKPVRVSGTCRDITERVRADQELRLLSARILRLQDEARRKIARDLHDSTGQNLVALAAILGQLHKSIPSSARRSRKLLSTSRALAERSVREIRTLSYLLHPPMLDEAGLVEAIRHFTSGFAERTGIGVDLDISSNFGRLTPDMELGLFRVVQESLTNIQRHSGSYTARIRMDRDLGNVTLEVSDTGRGISASQPVHNKKTPPTVGVGIPSMQERVAQIGGRLDIESSTKGTTVRVTVPFGEHSNENTSYSVS